MLPSIFGEKKACLLYDSPPKEEELRRKKHWKHTMTFHQTHALMQSWLESMAVFVLMYILRPWGWIFSRDVKYYVCTHTDAPMPCFSRPLKVTPAVFFGVLPTSTKQSQLSKAVELQGEFCWVNRFVAVLDMGKQGPIHPPLHGGRKQKEERKNGGVK